MTIFSYRGDSGEMEHRKPIVPALVSTDDKLDSVSVELNDEESGGKNCVWLHADRFPYNYNVSLCSDDESSDSNSPGTPAVVSNSPSENAITQKPDERSILHNLNSTAVHSTVSVETKPVKTTALSETSTSTATTSTSLDDGFQMRIKHTFYRSKPKEENAIKGIYYIIYSIMINAQLNFTYNFIYLPNVIWYCKSLLT